MIRRRTLVSSALAGSAALALAACGKSSGTSAASSTASASPVIGKVTVDGAFGSEPKVGFAAPLAVHGSEAKVISKGDGPAVAEGDDLGLHTLYVNAKDGKVLQSSWQGGPGEFLVVSESSNGKEATAFLTTATVGSRIEMVGTVTDSSGQKLSVVQVSDIVSVALKRAQGTPQPVPADQVQFTLGDDGAPALTGKPTMAVPPQTVATVSIQGSGEQTAAGDCLAIHYTGWKLSDGSQFDSSWKRGEPYSFVLGQGAVIQGWDSQLADRAVGSQLLLVIPPAEAYKDQGDLAGETLIFVVDILGAVKAPAA